MRTPLLIVVVALSGLSCRAANAPCQLTSECLDSEVCRSGWCRTTCNADSDCQSGETCRDGACLSVLIETPDAGRDGARTDAVVADGMTADAVSTDRGGQDQLSTDAARMDSATADSGHTDTSHADAGQPEAATCTESNIYWDTTDPCPGSENCTINLGTDLVECLPGAVSGTPYQSCADGGLCPHGSTCMPMESMRCLPFCRVDDLRCPDYATDKPGLCLYQAPIESTALCERPWACDPIGDTGCPSSLHCYRVFQWGNLCVDFNVGLTLDQACTGDLECVTGLVCDPLDHRCRYLCAGPTGTPCPGVRTCFPHDAPYGVCRSSPPDAGNDANQEAGSGQ